MNESGARAASRTSRELSRGKSSTAKSVGAAAQPSAAGAPLRVSSDYATRYGDASARATECALNAVRLGDLFMAALGRLWAAEGLSASSGNVLMILTGAGEPLPPHVISQRMLVTRGAVTGLLDALEKRGYARRTPHPRDRRMLLAEATPEGRHVAQRMQPRIVELELELAAALSAADQERFVKLSGRLQASLTAWLETGT